MQNKTHKVTVLTILMIINSMQTFAPDRQRIQEGIQDLAIAAGGLVIFSLYCVSIHNHHIAQNQAVDAYVDQLPDQVKSCTKDKKFNLRPAYSLTDSDFSFGCLAKRSNAPDNQQVSRLIEGLKNDQTNCLLTDGIVQPWKPSSFFSVTMGATIDCFDTSNDISQRELKNKRCAMIAEQKAKQCLLKVVDKRNIQRHSRRK